MNTALLTAAQVPELLVAHRGESAEAPQNTMAAFRLAWARQRSRTIETDVYVSRDGQIFCHHDPTFEHTAGVPDVVDSLSWAEIQRLDVGSWFSPKFKNERVPLLEELLLESPDDWRIYLEIKRGGAQFPELLRKLLKKCRFAEERITIISFEREELIRMNREYPAFESSLLIWPCFDEDVQQERWPIERILSELKATGCNGLDCGFGPSLNQELVDKVRSENYKMQVWTVDDVPRAKQALEMGFELVTTNCPTQLYDKWFE